MPTSTETERRRVHHLTTDEASYLLARVVLSAVLGVLFAMGIVSTGNALGREIYFAAFVLLGMTTALIYLAVFAANMPVSKAMFYALPLDLLVIVAYSYIGPPDDSFYPVVLLTTVVAALLLSKRNAAIATAGIALAYAVGVALTGPESPAMGVLMLCKVATIPFVFIMVSSSVERRRMGEREAEAASIETASLNASLRRRVSELQAVSQITEIIHSSLDFEPIAGQIIDIVADAVRVESCCLFVIDKEHSETLFSASRGTGRMTTDSLDPVIGTAIMGDEHLTCIPVFDHGEMMVLFCTTAESLNRLSDDERIVIGAVASELVVAVENSRLYKLASRLAITDELTGLANYRHLQQRLDEEIARADRYGKHLSLLMLDADNFKAFNDAQGHLAGDGALSDLGPIMRGLVREVDLVARYGGEEFAIVLPETDPAGAYVVGEKIREAVEKYRFRDSEGIPSCSLTLSIGIATYPTHGADKELLLREADDALYHAKNGGRNRVRAPRRTVAMPNASVIHVEDEWTGA